MEELEKSKLESADHEDEEVCCCGHHHHHDDDDNDEHCGCGHHHHHADDVFASWGRETVNKYTKEQLESILEELIDSSKYGMVLRAKGIVPSEDGKWLHFDYIPGEPDVREGGADVTGKICVIGSGIKEEEIQKLFRI